MLIYNITVLKPLYNFGGAYEFIQKVNVFRIGSGGFGFFSDTCYGCK
jgi:hypothetical protein